MDYDKIVRDQIPNIILKSGKAVRIAQEHPRVTGPFPSINKKYKEYLVNKLKEEYGEYVEAVNEINSDKEIEELMDMLCVIKYLLNTVYSEDNRALITDDLNQLYIKGGGQSKEMKNGGFREGYILKEVND